MPKNIRSNLKKHSYLFFNGMSRNGTSLVYQLLINNINLLFLPGRITFICSNPKLHPLEKDFDSASEFFDCVMDKMKSFEGNDWQKGKFIDCQETKGFDLQKLKHSFLKSYNGSFHTKDNKNAFDSLINHFISHRKEQGYFINFDAQLTVLQEDHAFLIPPSMHYSLLGKDIIFVQVVRKILDVLASRKNFLLTRLKYHGDPCQKTLNTTAIKNEILRAVWSYYCAYLNNLEHEHYHILSYESLKRDSREQIKQLLVNIGINNKEIILPKSNRIGDLGLLKVKSSFAHVSSQRPKFVDVYKKTLNKDEIECAQNQLEGMETLYPEMIFSKDFGNNITSIINAHPILSNWLMMREQKNDIDKICKQYSLMNYGVSNAKNAFLQ